MNLASLACKNPCILGRLVHPGMRVMTNSSRCGGSNRDGLNEISEVDSQWK